MAFFLMGWFWFQSSSSVESTIQSAGRLERCKELAQEIRHLKELASDRVKFAASNFYPSTSVADVVKEARLFNDKFTTSENGLNVIEGTNVRRFRISIPTYKITLRQVALLVSKLAEAEMKYQTTSIKLTRPASKGEPTGSVEKWDVSFGEIVYLKQLKEKEKRR
jgi:hypothetical protein